MTSNNEIRQSKAMQEIDAIRLQIHNETRGLTISAIHCSCPQRSTGFSCRAN